MNLGNRLQPYAKARSLSSLCILSIALFVLCFPLNGSAELGGLPRQGDLGFIPTVLPTGEIAVRSIRPGGASESADIAIGDILVAIDGERTPDIAAATQMIEPLIEGQSVSVTFKRNNEEFNVDLVLKGLSFESIENGVVEYGHITLGNGDKVRTIMTRPDNSTLQKRGRFPAVHLVRGIGCESVEVLRHPRHPLSRLLQSLNNAGFATLRVEKPGLGDSLGEHCRDITFTHELEAVQQAVKEAKKKKYVDSDRFYAVGISLGGIEAPLASQSSPYAGIITWGSAVQPWFDYLIANLRLQGVFRGEDPVALDKRMRDLRAKLAQHIMLPDDEFEEDIRNDDQQTLAGRHYRFHRDLDKYDLYEAWAAYSGRLVSLHGEFDFISDIEDHKLAAFIVDRNNPGSAEFQILEGLDHALTAHPDLETAIAQYGRGEREGNVKYDRFFHAIIEKLNAWSSE